MSCHPGRRAMLSQIITSGSSPIKIIHGWYLVYRKCAGYVNQATVPFPLYSYLIMSAIASQITAIPIVYSTVCSGNDQRKHQSSSSLAFVRGIRRWPVKSPHKGPVTRKMLPFDDFIIRWFPFQSRRHVYNIVIMEPSLLLSALS